MLNRNIWKLTLSLGVVLWALTSLLPLQDRPFPEYIQSEAESKTAEFGQLLEEASAKVAADEAPSVFVALKSIANERRVDLSQYFPQVRLESTLHNIEKRNGILMDHLLKESKGRLQLGLDLKGGVAFTLEVDESALSETSDSVREEKLSKAIEIIGNRINGLGVTEPVIRPVGDRRIEVQLPGVNTKDNPQIVDSVKKPARLDFRLVHPFQTPLGSPEGEIPAGYEILSIDHERRDGTTATEELFVKRVPEMTGEGVSDSYPVMDEFGNYRIILRFTTEGSRQFATVTKEIAGFTQQLQQRTGNPDARARLAIVLDGRLYSAPGVAEEIKSDSAEISGTFSQREAFDLANVLNNPLDLPLSIQEQYEVAPTLAADSIASGAKAFLIGISLTAIFMVLFYSAGGFFAVLAMALNVVIILGVMASLGATLTMPGIAGIVLTIGMAVDSNILIFERIREELRLGKSLPAALEAGFEKAFSAIIDGNLTTLITAAIMIALGNGPVKGFGVTLAIGIFSTMFSALVVSRLFLNLVVDGGIMKKFPMLPILQDKSYDFLKYAKPAFIGAWILVLVGVSTAVVKRDTIYGIDFTGGDQIALNFEQKVDLSELTSTINAAGFTDINLGYTQEIGGDREVLRVGSPFGSGAAIADALAAAHPDAGFNLDSQTTIGPSVGAEIQANAAWAIFWSLLLILVYVAFRFEMGYGVGAVVATIHDVLMTIGIFVLCGRQFNASMVAAILLVAGYSINDTIVVFDRIREEMLTNPHATLRNLINRALNLTLSRTIMTGGTTLLTALSLFIFAGGQINDIALTLIIGVIVGTFSSLFIACPVFFWWHKGDRKHVEERHDAKPVYEWTASSKASE
ncbi:MAG: protein translocase subunit SecD [Verrucomicrobiota bacterium]